MTQDYSTEAAAVADALNAVYENKQVNKKDDISGDFSSDTASYPTVKAVKSLYGTKVTSWSGTVSDSNIPSEKLVKDSLDGKLNTTYSSYKGKNVVTNSSTGAIEFEDKYSHPSTKQCNYSYTHPSEKQCSYAYTHPSAKQCNATIPSKTSDLTNDGSSSSDSLVYVETSATTGLLKNDGTVMTSGTGSSNWAVGNHSHSGMLTSSDIADNLTTNDATKVLSAKQGKVLSGLIGDAIQYINQ